MRVDRRWEGGNPKFKEIGNIGLAPSKNRIQASPEKKKAQSITKHLQGIM